MTKEEILQEARKRFPIGTKYKCVKDKELGISATEVDYDWDGNIYARFQGQLGGCNQYVYANGKWAEIISKPEKIEKPIAVKCSSNKEQDIVVNFARKKEDNYPSSCKLPIENVIILESGCHCNRFQDYKIISFEEFKATYMPEEKWEPKVGDWVLLGNYCYEYNGKIVKITKIIDGFYYFEPSNSLSANFAKSMAIRKAEPHEIPEEKPQFEVGKWYNNKHGFYCKFEKIGSRGGFQGEAIVGKKLLKDYQFEKGYNWKLLTDLLEIQQYLPEDHPDKEVAPPDYYEYIGNTNSDFIKGKVYKIVKPHDLEAICNFINEKGKADGWSGENYKRFKPSTKEAFEAQNKPEEKSVSEYIPKLGEYYAVDGKERLEGRIIVGYYSSEWDNVRCKGPNVSNFNGKFTFDQGGCCFKSSDRKARPATLDEIKWLDACIKANKFIPKEEALKSENVMNKGEKLLEEARIRFKDCKTFRSAIKDGSIVSFLGVGNYESNVYSKLDDCNGDVVWNSTNGWLYFNGKWADIVEYNTPKAKYKVGDKLQINGKGEVRCSAYGINVKVTAGSNYEEVVKRHPTVTDVAFSKGEYWYRFGTNNWYTEDGLEPLEVKITNNWCVPSYGLRKEIVEWGRSLNTLFDGSAFYYGIKDGKPDYSNSSWGEVIPVDKFISLHLKYPMTTEECHKFKIGDEVKVKDGKYDIDGIGWYTSYGELQKINGVGGNKGKITRIFTHNGKTYYNLLCHSTNSGVLESCLELLAQPVFNTEKLEQQKAKLTVGLPKLMSLEESDDMISTSINHISSVTKKLEV